MKIDRPNRTNRCRVIAKNCIPIGRPSAILDFKVLGYGEVSLYSSSMPQHTKFHQPTNPLQLKALHLDPTEGFPFPRPSIGPPSYILNTQLPPIAPRGNDNGGHVNCYQEIISQMVIDADLCEILYEDTKSESDHNDCRVPNFQNLIFRICTRERYGRSCYNPLLGAAAYSLELSGRHTCFRTFLLFSRPH